MIRHVITVVDNWNYVNAINIVIEWYNTIPHRSLGNHMPEDMYKKDVHIPKSSYYRRCFKFGKPVKTV